jgi:hypothetical protein
MDYIDRYHITYQTEDGRQVDLWCEFNQDEKVVRIYGKVGEKEVDRLWHFTYVEDAPVIGVANPIVLTSDPTPPPEPPPVDNSIQRVVLVAGTGDARV